MIPQTFIQDLLARLDLVDVIERDLPLKRAGANWSARCPFHEEKSPSFTVSQSKQFYHCFGCGKHGNAIGWLMEYSGLDFIAAVKELAASAGMIVPEPQRVQGESRAAEDAGAELPHLMVAAAQYYKGQLKQSPAAIAYLKQRGLTGEVAARYALGYAPAGWQNLESVLPYHESIARDTGLVIENDEGKRYDRFRDRIVFPIQNVRGAIVGFGGRSLGGGEPKYLNSPETPLFEKGHELYGLFQARRAIREAGRVVVVEGYMDVVALSQHGIGYAVATLGTATTPTHVQKLLRQSDEVIFCFDGDAAGSRAAWRALENSLGQLVDGKQVSFLFLPQGEDPDSFVRKAGGPAFEALLGDALPLTEFLVRELAAAVNLQTVEGRARLLRDARPLAKQVVAPILGLMLRGRLASLSGVTQGEFDALCQIKPPVATRSRPTPARAPSRAPSVVRKLAELLLFDPALVRLADREKATTAAKYGLPGIAPNEIAVLHHLLEFLESVPKAPNIAMMTEHFRGGEHENWLKDIGPAMFAWEERKLGAAGIEAEFAGAWAQFLEQLRKARPRGAEWDSEKQGRYLRLQRGTQPQPIAKNPL